MEFFSLHTLLFAARWVFVGLIYFVLLMVLVAVRRELAVRLRSGQLIPSTAVARLRVMQPGSDAETRPGARWLLKIENTLGAEAGNDLILKDEFASGRHARLRWDGAGWALEDLGSANGTFINGERLVPFTPRPVALGAQLQFGDMVFELQE